MIVLPAMPPEQTASWLGVLDLYDNPITLYGVIAGGGMRENGPGRLGVFLRHNPADFGL